LGLAISGEMTQYFTEANEGNEGKPSFSLLD
jgi:hypothetical protein